jgi:hypothetical protein
MNTPHSAGLPAGNAWIAQHQAQLQHHVEQCWTRPATLTAAQCLDAVHAALGGRFMTTVCAVAAVMLLLPALF